jgi:hypothetical protein
LAGLILSTFKEALTPFFLLSVFTNATRLAVLDIVIPPSIPKIKAPPATPVYFKKSLRLTFFILFHSVVPPLTETETASRMRTPLAEFAVRALMLLVLALFQAADEPMGCYLKTHSIFVDKLFIFISHSLYPLSLHI